MTDAQLCGVSRDTIRGLAETVSHKHYTEWKLKTIRKRIAEMTDQYSMLEMEELKLIPLLNYRNKAIRWLEYQLKEMETGEAT